MTRKHPASTVDRSLAAKYFDKAARFKADAEKMSVLAAAALLERLGAFSRWTEKTFADLRRRSLAP